VRGRQGEAKPSGFGGHSTHRLAKGPRRPPPVAKAHIYPKELFPIVAPKPKCGCGKDFVRTALALDLGPICSIGGLSLIRQNLTVAANRKPAHACCWRAPWRHCCRASSAGRVANAPDGYCLGRADPNQRRTSMPSLSKIRKPSGGVFGYLSLIPTNRCWREETSSSKSWGISFSTSTGRASY
jgi:hypothetical protein